jgi:putative ABC transport system permease protein
MARTRVRRSVADAIPSGRPAWRKAPTRLIHRPTLFVALAVGGILVALTVSAAPLFLSASEGQLVTSTIANPIYTRYGAGLTYRSTGVPFSARAPSGGSLTTERRHVFAEAVAKSPELGPMLASTAAPPVQVTAPGKQVPTVGAVLGRLFAGTDALDHVRILSGSDGDGVWLPSNIATPLHAGPGDRVELHDGATEVTVPVNGVYAAIYTSPPDGFWQPWAGDMIYQFDPDAPLPPQFMITDEARLIELQKRLDHPIADQAMQAPVRPAPQLTLDDAHELRSFVTALEARMQIGPSSDGSLFLCCGRIPVNARVFPPQISNITLHSAVNDVVKIVDQRAVGVRGPVIVLVIAGMAISLAAVAAAGLFSFASRPDEAGLFRARGWGPVRVGARMVVESMPPIVLGSAVAYGMALALVAGPGPSGAITPAAVRAAIIASGGAAIVSVLLVGVVAGLRFVSGHERERGAARALMWVPWELLAIGGAVALGSTLRGQGGIVRSGSVQQARPAVFLFPLAVSLASALLTARVVTVVMARRARDRRGVGASSSWLATRRFASSARLGAIFLVAATLAVSAFISASALVASLRTTVDAKAKIFVGSDVKVDVVPDASTPKNFPLPVTEVQRALDAGRFDSGQAFDVLVVDPSTFATAAFWDDGFSDEPLEDLMSRLDGGKSNPLPIVVANGAGISPSSITVGSVSSPVEVVGHAETFPGSSSNRPIVVVGRDSVVPALHVGPYAIPSSNSRTELWIRGPTDDAIAAIRAANIQTFVILTADQIKDNPLITAAVNTFLALDVLGVAALLLVLVLVIVFLQARQRTRVVSSALSSRMGVPVRTLRLALALELGGLLLVAIAVGALVSVGSTPVVVGSLDPIPSIPPPPISVVPWLTILAAGVLMLGAALTGVWFSDRATRRDSLGEVMRVA